MTINPSEVTKLLKDQIKNFGEKSEISEVELAKFPPEGPGANFANSNYGQAPGGRSKFCFTL